MAGDGDSMLGGSLMERLRALGTSSSSSSSGESPLPPEPPRAEEADEPEPEADTTTRAPATPPPAGAGPRLRLSSGSVPIGELSTSSFSAPAPPAGEPTRPIEAATEGFMDDGGPTVRSVTSPPEPAPDDGGAALRMPTFRPLAPRSLREAEITGSAVEALIVKYLAATPRMEGRRLARDIGLPGRLVRELLAGLKNRKIVVHTGHAGMGDFEFSLSEKGRALAFDLNKTNRYAGRAPVSLRAYAKSVAAQSVTQERPKRADLERAFAGLLIEPGLLDRLGPALHAGRGFFMFGAPGNGKTSIAERVTATYRSPVFVPFAVDFGGQLVRVFDPAVHRPVSRELARQVRGSDKLDGRWVLCHRPTVVVGGELTMDSLELTFDEWSGTCEAPVQLKSNGGTLVIDDLGRQVMAPAALLNRWIVPMEKRVDFLNVPGGRKVEVPFDLMLVFSTNLEPRSLVDDAFLRRIPYKINVRDPDEATFRVLLHSQAKALGLTIDEAHIEGLFARHYRGRNRSMRMCQPRDLLMLIKHICEYRGRPLAVDDALFDEAVGLYFSVI